MSELVHVDLEPDEILTTPAAITFTVPEKADTREIGKLVTVRGAQGRITRTRTKNAFRWSAPEGMSPGQYRIIIEALTDEENRKLTERIEVPFTVVETAAEIKAQLRLESFSRVRIDDRGVSTRFPIGVRPRGNYVEYFKAVDRRTGAGVDLAFDQSGKQLDPGEAVAEFHKRAFGRYGKVHPALAERLGEAGEGQRLRVDVWLNVDVPGPVVADRPDHDCGVEAAGARARELRERWHAAARSFAAEVADAEVVHVDRLAPVVTLEMQAGEIQRLAENEQVLAILLHEVEGIEDLQDSMDIARSTIVHGTGETGAGVRVAVWENGPTSTADLVIAGRFQTSPSTSNHSQNVHAIIRNDEDDEPHGHARGCSLYSANSMNRSALTWAVEDADCTVVNQSFHRSSEPGSGSLSSDDLYGDWLALHWPYPLIVHAAGNFWNGDPDNIDPPDSEFVNHKGYNTISVGNHDDDADAMAGSSVFRNPSSPHGDRELPEITGNGTSVTATGITMTGTSQASPAVAGVAALLQGTSGTLKHWPEGCRAILAAGAERNVSDDTWWRDVLSGVDASDGAGAVNARQSQLIAQNRRYRGAPATQRGWDVGLLTSSDFGSDQLSTFEYRISVSRFAWGPRNVKVALAWTSAVQRVDLPFIGPFFLSNLAVDLDLKVFDARGRQVGYSGSWDNSYEIVEFTGSPGQTYTIRIRRWSGDKPTWYGIAWNLTGGLQIAFPLELESLVLSRLGRDS